jgi:hypothetical protein
VFVFVFVPASTAVNTPVMVAVLLVVIAPEAAIDPTVVMLPDELTTNDPAAPLT